MGEEQFMVLLWTVGFQKLKAILWLDTSTIFMSRGEEKGGIKAVINNKKSILIRQKESLDHVLIFVSAQIWLENSFIFFLFIMFIEYLYLIFVGILWNYWYSVGEHQALLEPDLLQADTSTQVRGLSLSVSPFEYHSYSWNSNIWESLQ